MVIATVETNCYQKDRFKFTGREYRPELGIYYYRARWYDPAVGRFISQDPIGFSAGDANLYRYVGNAPGDGIDPSGAAKINLGNIKDGRVPVGYQGSWILFYGSEEFIGYLDPKNNSVERNGKLVSLNKLERIASSWWGFKPDWDEYFKENGYDPNSDATGTYFFLNMALGLYPDTFINDFGTGMGQITDLYETAMWHYAGAGFACGSGGSGKIPSKPVTIPGNTSVQLHSINLEALKPTQTVANHISKRPYINSPHTIRNIIESGTPRPDPAGVPGVLRWDVPGSFRGNAGTFELVIDPATNQILHFLFKSGR